MQFTADLKKKKKIGISLKKKTGLIQAQLNLLLIYFCNVILLFVCCMLVHKFKFCVCLAELPLH